MTSAIPQTTNITIRPFQFRDLEAIAHFSLEGSGVEQQGDSLKLGQRLQHIRRWYGLLKFFSLFPNPLQHLFSAYVAEQGNRIQGIIQVSPFNRTRSTWKVDQVAVEAIAPSNGDQPLSSDIGSQLLRYCFQAIWEARTWLIEVEVNDKSALALYRQNGFQSLAEMTYWAIAPELLEALAEREPDLPNLLPVSNADANLLHQLDTASMPPLVRQVFDRQILDFKTSLLGSVYNGMTNWMSHTEVISSYVFEPQRKAAIGYFQIKLCRDGSRPHIAQLTVHPAYTWLYPELLSQMARIAQEFPAQTLRLASADYQPEREEYLEQIGASRTEHTLMMSRSVWHKLREAKPVSLEGLHLSEVLQGFQPARKPVPSRISLIKSIPPLPQRNKLDLSQLGVQPVSPSPADSQPPNSKDNTLSDLPDSPNLG
ncbi:MAG: GNAT family N-acetyltransferase [Leptolyngbyaceae cyanobacterium SM1_4_3]|nr:GNAT family N-acetyltransferase [Leptolyngbyaceae cyanobacterium SM1_4_3]NJN92314.1 GNAT family N-acetyltransferase [Leptolyngbyaceae cyanobacterium SL_5_14]